MDQANPMPQVRVPSLKKQAFAGFWRRFAAFMLDCVIVVPTALLIAWPLGTLPFLFDPRADAVGVFGLSPHVARLITTSLTVLVYDIYFAGMVHGSGHTIAMHLLGVTVVDANGQRPTKRAARLRYFGASLAVMALGLGLLAILSDRQRRGWHDRMAGTWAVRQDVLSQIAETQGITHKFDAPITARALLFLPGMALCAGLVMALLFTGNAVRRRPVPKRPQDYT
jgi:uncharacterized RDD family membrane protein YckC